ncbi:MAG: stage II sporulation protein M [Myxococcota bacterium]
MSTQPRSVAFRKLREAEWHELDQLTERALKGGLAKLTGAELRRLPVLYRQTLSALSVARRTALDPTLIAYLEALSGRAYLAVYGSRRQTRGALRRALAHAFPRQVRALAAEVALSLAITATGVMVAMLLMNEDLGWYDAFVDPGLASGRDPQASTESLRSALYDSGDGSSLTVFASFLFTHNSQVALTCFALGFAAGVPTMILLFTNGLMLGAFLSLYASRGMLVPLLGWLLPHGIPEIGAIILCGAAGMHLGRSMLWPGRLTVRASLKAAGRRASMVVFGSVALLAIAGVLEGVLRQVIRDDVTRFSLATFNAVWFLGWLLLGGRKSEAQDGD